MAAHIRWSLEADQLLRSTPGELPDPAIRHEIRVSLKSLHRLEKAIPALEVGGIRSIRALGEVAEKPQSLGNHRNPDAVRLTGARELRRFGRQIQHSLDFCEIEQIVEVTVGLLGGRVLEALEPALVWKRR